MTRVKICGLRDPATAVAAAAAGADLVGLVFAESRRRVTPQECYDVVEAVHAVRRTPGPVVFDAPVVGEVRGLSWFGAWSEAIETALARWRPLVVGVFANQPWEEVNDIAAAAGLDLVQISGNESADDLRRIERPVIRTLHVSPATSAEELLAEAAGLRVAGFLLDTASREAYGGTGEPFDWDVARETARRLPFLLAGGLTPENVAAAVAQVAPWAIDVSSGVESGGSKDVDKIRAFIRAARGAAVGQ